MATRMKHLPWRLLIFKGLVKFTEFLAIDLFPARYGKKILVRANLDLIGRVAGDRHADTIGILAVLFDVVGREGVKLLDAC